MQELLTFSLVHHFKYQEVSKDNSQHQGTKLIFFPIINTFIYSYNLKAGTFQHFF